MGSSHPLSITLLPLLLLLLPSPAHTCPAACACSGPVVDCYGRRLLEIPDDLPEDTTHLDLQDNEITTVHPERLTRLPQLDTLYLRLNLLTALGPDTFVNLTRLKMLHLGNNDIVSIDQDAFQNVPSLQVLNLMNNKLTDEVAGKFSSLVSVERLALSLNKLTSLNDHTLSGLTNLTYLILSQNNISRVSKGALAHSKQLSYLVLRGNPLGNIDDVFEDVGTLSYLDLSSCQLKAVPIGLPWALRYLRLSENNITTIRSHDLDQTRYLGSISFDNNQIYSVQEGALANKPHLHDVGLSHNRLYSLPQPIPQSVEKFIADDNLIKRVFQANFDHDSHLKLLSLQHNQISAIVANTFLRLGNLTSLFLGDNRVETMHEMAFAGLRKLNSLSLDKNPVRTVDARALGGLQRLKQFKLSDVSSDVTNIQGNIFQDVPSLVSLDLHNSSSVVFDILNSTEHLRGLQSLVRLNLADSGLDNIPEHLKDMLPNLKSLKLSGNPWKCEAPLLHLRNWMVSEPKKFSYSDDVQCGSPEYLKGLVVKNMGEADFTMPTTTTTTTTTPSTTAITESKDSVDNSNSTTLSNVVNNSTTAFLPSTSEGEASTLSTKPQTPGGTTFSADQTSTSQPSSTAMTTSRNSAPPSSTTTTTSGSRTAILTTLEQTTSQDTTESPSPSLTPTYNAITSSVTNTTFTKTTRGPPQTTTKTKTTTTTTDGETTTTKTSPLASLTTHKTTGTSPKTMETATMGGETTKKNRQTPNHPSTTISTTSDKSTENTDKPEEEESTQPSDRNTNDTSTAPEVFPNVNRRAGASSTGGDNRLPTFSSSADSKTRAIIIGVSVCLICLVVGAFIAVAVVRYRRKRKRLALDDKEGDNGPTPSSHPDSTDTVFIIRHMAGNDDETNNFPNTTKNMVESADDSTSSYSGMRSPSDANNAKRKPSGESESGSSAGGMSKTRKILTTFKRSISATSSTSFDCISGQRNNDDEMLMSAWDDQHA